MLITLQVATLQLQDVMVLAYCFQKNTSHMVQAPIYFFYSWPAAVVTAFRHRTMLTMGTRAKSKVRHGRQ